MPNAVSLNSTRSNTKPKEQGKGYKMATKETTFATTTKSHVQVQTHTGKPRPRKSRETTISSPAITPTPTAHEGANVSPNKYSNAHIQSLKHYPSTNPIPQTDPAFSSQLFTDYRSPLMDVAPATTLSSGHQSHFTKFNSALTAGLLNPMSPPPDMIQLNPIRSSPTLFEMMSGDPNSQPSRNQNSNNCTELEHNPKTTIQDKQALIMQRIGQMLRDKSPGNQFNEASSSDVKITLSSRDGVSVEINLHRQILVGHSRFFAVKLSDRDVKEQRVSSGSGRYEVEIADCEDVEDYVETLRLMYCKDLKRWLMREDVNRVLGILKISTAIGFDAGVVSCLEYLEAAPWAEEQEEKVTSLLSELHLERVGVEEVLKRVTIHVTNGAKETSYNDQVLLKLLYVILEGKDEKARREMKGLVSKMFHENSLHNDIRKESLYAACDGCLQLLRGHFLRAASGNMDDAGQLAKQADNLHWILDILIDRYIAEDFLKTWASQLDLVGAHSKIPAVHRYEISRITARLFVGIGKSQLLASKEDRHLLLCTWLVPFYEDFCWLRRASKGLDRHLIEEGLSNTILTLPLALQQEILLAWFDRFLNFGDDCPNIQRAFEVWWRRAFRRRSGEQERALPIKISTATVDYP